MLALDGGGIRGLLTLGILERSRRWWPAATGRKLGDYFDYIAGTSTGAIIAAGLARGMTVAELDRLLPLRREADVRALLADRTRQVLLHGRPAEGQAAGGFRSRDQSGAGQSEVPPAGGYAERHYRFRMADQQQSRSEI